MLSYAVSGHRHMEYYMLEIGLVVQDPGMSSRQKEIAQSIPDLSPPERKGKEGLETIYY